MDSDRINRWLSLIANFGVVVGLILLVVEIRQNTDLIRQDAIVARASFGGGAFEDEADMHAALTEAGLSEIFTKVVDGSETLNTQEAIRMSHFLSQVVTMLNRDGYGAVVGVYEHNPRMIERVVPQFFGNSFARLWWETSRSRYPEPFARVIDRVVSETSVDANKKHYENLHSQR